MDEGFQSAVQKLVEPILEQRQVELVELSCQPRGGQTLVRLLIDTVSGVTVQDCAHINQRVGEALDQAGLIEGSYTLEVSSPGLDRPLLSKRDFERAIGEQLLVETQEEEGKFKLRRGMLLAVQHEAIVLKNAGETITVVFDRIRSAKKALPW